MRKVLLVFGLCLVMGLASVASAQISKGGPTDLDASPDEMLTHVVKVLRTSNKAQTNRYVPKVYEFKNVNPADVVRFYMRVMEIEEGAWYSFGKQTGDEVKGGKVLVILPLYQVESVDKMMALLDRDGLTTSSGDGTAWARLKHRTVTDTTFANAVLANSSTRDVLVLTDAELNGLFLLDAPSSVRRTCAALARLDVPTPQVKMELTLYEISMQNDGQMGLDFHAWKNGPGRNLFAVGAFWEKEKVTSLRNATKPLQNGLPGTSSYNHGANAAMLYEVPSAYMDFLVVKGKAKVSTTAQVTVMHSRTAVLQTTDTLLYYAVQDARGRDLSGATATGSQDISNAVLGDPLGRGGFIDANASTNVVTPGLSSGSTINNQSSSVAVNRTMIGSSHGRGQVGTGTTNLLESGWDPDIITGSDTGVYLSVTPTIGTELVNLDINFRIINHIGYGDNGVPILNRRTSETNVKCVDGKEIVMGGLTHETYLRSVNKIPVLGSIPYLGYLFGGERKQALKRMVVLVVKPTVLRGEFAGLSTSEGEFCTECSSCDIEVQ